MTAERHMQKSYFFVVANKNESTQAESDGARARTARGQGVIDASQLEGQHADRV